MQEEQDMPEQEITNAPKATSLSALTAHKIRIAKPLKEIIINFPCPVNAYSTLCEVLDLPEASSRRDLGRECLALAVMFANAVKFNILTSEQLVQLRELSK